MSYDNLLYEAYGYQLDESSLRSGDKNFQEQVRIFLANTGDVVLGKNIERQYYVRRDYIAARKIRLAYKPYDIMIARTKVIKPAVMARGRVILYLKQTGSNSTTEWTTYWKDEASGKEDHERSWRTWKDAIKDFNTRTAVMNNSRKADLDNLEDGYPASYTVYMGL